MAVCFVADDIRQERPHVDSWWIAWEEANAHYLGKVLYRTWDTPQITSGIDLWDHSTNTSQGLADWLATFNFLTNIRHRCLLPSQYYRRIYRLGGDGLRDEAAMRQTAVATSILIDRMEQVFRVVEPDATNLSAFGHEIRNLLLLACMEVEAALCAILRANGCTAPRLSTADYVKLQTPLHLSDYELRLAFYPHIPPISPFAGWQSARPTKSLAWYDAYNQTKHDREQNFAAATLKHAIDAVVAAVILAYAQFGLAPIFSQRFSIFTDSKLPAFPIEEWYTFEDKTKVSSSGNKLILQAFSPVWVPVDCPL